MPRTNNCELEFRVQWLDRGVYFVVGKFSDPARDQENYVLDPVRIEMDLPRLLAESSNTDAYGRILTENFFGGTDNTIRMAYLRARDAASTQEGGLRIRLSVQMNAPELHAVRWEALRDPVTGTPLLTQSNVWFSRFISAEDYRLLPLSDQSRLQALVVIANPTDIQSKWGHALIEKDAEFAKAKRAFAPYPGSREIAVRRLDAGATIYNIVSELRANRADILYLVCHGALVQDDEPRLLLEGDSGAGEMVRGEQLVERLAGLTDVPRLVVLASCQSAGGSGGVAFGAIGPRLVQAGVASVVAMQGNITVDSADRFMQRLFRELSQHGQIDRAVAAARNDVRDSPDWWMPVLFMRSRTGSLWQARSRGAETFDQWEAVVTDVRDGDCVPVLGPSLVEPLFGSTREIATRWAERYEFPLAPRNRDDLAQVAQYLAYRQSSRYALQELRAYMVNYLRQKYGDDLPSSLSEGSVQPGVVDKLISTVGAIQRKKTPKDVHGLLAKFPARIYVNANRDNLLRDALIEEGRKPQIQLCTWRSSRDMPLPIGPQPERGYEPSVEHPLIFHVFGNLEYPDSLVLTEDDYFSFLIAVTRNDALKKLGVPSKVTSAMASSGLLLLGFHVDDWDFRVLFSSILRQPGGGLAGQRARVAVQMDPSETGIIDPDRASVYLSRYFERQAQIGLYIGSAEEFMSRLIDLCTKEGLVTA